MILIHNDTFEAAAVEFLNWEAISAVAEHEAEKANFEAFVGPRQPLEVLFAGEAVAPDACPF